MSWVYCYDVPAEADRCPSTNGSKSGLGAWQCTLPRGHMGHHAAWPADIIGYRMKGRTTKRK